MNKSFTLIEILVVIVVIGVLSAFILVGMSSISSKANIAKNQAFINSLDNSLLISRVSQWKLDELAGSINDSWELNTGTNYGATSSSNCAINNCYNFDGNDYIEINDSATLKPSAAFTISAWIKPTAYTNGAILVKAYNTSTWKSYYFAIIAGGKKIRLEVTTSATASPQAYPDWDTTNEVVVTNNWLNVVATYKTISNSATDANIYINSNKSAITYNANSDAVGKNLLYSTMTLNIGRNHSGATPGEYFTGYIDEIRFYNEVVPTYKIHEDYYAGLNRLFWKNEIKNKEYSTRINQLALN